MSQWICTANTGFAPYAMEEMRRRFEGISNRQLAAGEVFLADIPLEREVVIRAIAADEPIFLRHIHSVDRTLAVTGSADDLEALSEIARRQAGYFRGRRTAVHVRKAGGSLFPYQTADVKALIDAVLTEEGAEAEMKEPERILSLYAAAETLYVGWGTPAEQLSDWPGGAVRFQREEGQISRAKFKLLEAERAFGLDYGAYRSALDIGAAPGGWTSLLLERGLPVTAVDPAELHPTLLGHPNLVYKKANAGDVSFKSGAFDLLVCDMSWSPMGMVKLVLEQADAVAAGGTAVITVKLMHRKPLQTIRDVIARLQPAFSLVKAKQLFHNRDEITLYLIRNR